MGRKNNYNNDIHPKTVEALCIKGFTIEDIAKMLGVSTACLYSWKEKYPDFCDAIDNGRDKATGEVVGALYKKSTGFYYWEKTYDLKEEQKNLFNKNGSPKKKLKKTRGRPQKPVWICTRRIKKYAQPDQRSIEFYLTNRKKTDWKMMTQIDVTTKAEYIIKEPEFDDEKKEKAK